MTKREYDLEGALEGALGMLRLYVSIVGTVAAEPVLARIRAWSELLTHSPHRADVEPSPFGDQQPPASFDHGDQSNDADKPHSD